MENLDLPPTLNQPSEELERTIDLHLDWLKSGGTTGNVGIACSTERSASLL